MADRDLPGEADIVIVGAGAAGLTAALAARRYGASVIVLERSDKIGGTSALSGALVWAPLNSYAAKAGFKDNRADAIAYMCAAMGGEADRAMVETFVDSIGAVADELERMGGARFIATPYPDSFVEFPGGVANGRHIEPAPYHLGRLGAAKRRVRPGVTRSPFTTRELLQGGFVARLTSMIRARLPMIAWRMLGNVHTAGIALVARMYEAALRHGVRFGFNARVSGLQSADGRIVGVEIAGKSGPRIVRAKRGVVLANGGYEWNDALVRAHLTAPLGLNPSPPGLAEGDNLTLAAQAGAQLDHLDWCWNWPAMTTPGVQHEGAPVSTLVLGERTLPHCIWINRDGARFCNEAAHNAAFALEERDADGRLRNLPAWIVLDAQYRRKYPLMLKLMPGSKDPPWLKSYASLEALAEDINAPADRLAATIARFNAFAQSGVDEDFQRGSHGYERAFGDQSARNPNLGSIAEPPFYAIPLHVCAVGTRGGPRINTRAQVMRQDGAPAPGLYAAGNAAACFYGPNIVGGGATIAPAIAFAWLAVRHALGADNTPLGAERG